MTETTHYFYELFTHYQAGFLLESGAVNDQPTVYLEAMNTFSSIKAAIEKEQMDDIKNQSKRSK